MEEKDLSPEQMNLLEKSLYQALEEVKYGRTIPAEDVFQEMEEKLAKAGVSRAV